MTDASRLLGPDLANIGAPILPRHNTRTCVVLMFDYSPLIVLSSHLYAMPPPLLKISFSHHNHHLYPVVSTRCLALLVPGQIVCKSCPPLPCLPPVTLTHPTFFPTSDYSCDVLQSSLENANKYVMDGEGVQRRLKLVTTAHQLSGG